VLRWSDYYCKIGLRPYLRTLLLQSHTIELKLFPDIMPSPIEHGPLGPPPTLSDDDCKDLDTIKAVLQKHALLHGYAISVDCSTPVKAAWVCSKSGQHRDHRTKDVPDKKRRKNTSTAKTGCKFRVSASRQGAMP
jgi:hypothetical protein